jgi:hypothetical protein
MVEPSGKKLAKINNNNNKMYLKAKEYVEWHNGKRRKHKSVWMHIADDQYGCTLVLNKKNLIKFRDTLTKIAEKII